jgi:peptidoglycan-associated lipoprotein
MRYTTIIVLTATVIGLAGAACSRRQAPATQPAPPPSAQPSPVAATPPAPPQRVDDVIPVPQAGLADEGITARSLDDLNRNSPFQPVFFPLDSAELDDAGRRTVASNAELLKMNPTWVITVEGHCDERGTAEYNLGLGERRAVAVKTYLLSLGIRPERIRTVSYGKEFPFDSGHNEEAWGKNRRAHFVVASR